MGIYGSDSPLALVQTLLDDMRHHAGPLDAILVNGDFVGHGFSVEPGTSPNRWGEMKEIIRKVIGEIVERYPDTPIFPSIGNNDVVYHYQAPTEE